MPRTIEGLKEWYAAKNLPPEETTRFFVGKDCKEPKAIGIYQDGDRFIVYMNKPDGSRVIWHEGGDEADAINELYRHLQEDVMNRKRKTGGTAGTEMSKGRVILSFVLRLFAFVVVVSILSGLRSQCSGLSSSNQPAGRYYKVQTEGILADAVNMITSGR